MIAGLDFFRNHFRDYTDQYVLIGGTACHILFEEAGVTFRATKDLDIVLFIEVLEPDFVRAFWSFILDGGYAHSGQGVADRRYYRFQKPSRKDYPQTIELFSRVPEQIELWENSNLTPIPVSEDISSLSAILLDESYYSFLSSGRIVINDLSIVDAIHLIPLKASAWLNLTSQRKRGIRVDSRSVEKHKNDVLRLARIVEPTAKITLPKRIRDDMVAFIDELEREPIALEAIGIKGSSKSSLLSIMRGIYLT